MHVPMTQKLSSASFSTEMLEEAWSAHQYHQEYYSLFISYRDVWIQSFQEKSTCGRF